MTEDELIKELAEPIIKQIEKIAQEHGSELPAIPRVEFVVDPNSLPKTIEGVEITSDLLKKLQEYLEDEIEMICAPTILH
ncbi:hypothetical protein [Floccifex sp.]|uniref:hypothetical protein n=1 Tax=Floccifex sp. TaxID=2815810 RepID=UPI002A74CC13|nr:hypothetical protein [Floccifex sp.]MDD7282015.1 hypothetical protein [Erysipelotrichaceae bacterium]MDY2958408.1 hypothetical protein [Floccifex sp.]